MSSTGPCTHWNGSFMTWPDDLVRSMKGEHMKIKVRDYLRDLEKAKEEGYRQGRYETSDRDAYDFSAPCRSDSCSPPSGFLHP